MGRKTIGIFTYSTQEMDPWDLESAKTGISGSEEAVIYLSQCLAKLGFRVLVFGNPPEDSPHALFGANPQFIREPYSLSSRLDLAISWRMPSMGPTLRNIADRVYLWPHDILPFPLKTSDVDSFDEVLWLSKWQRAQWISVAPGFERYAHCFGNGICPEHFLPVQSRANPYSCIYASNYGRGLQILADLWPQIHAEFPMATLDIYYGWRHWGALTHDEESNLRRKLARLAGVKEHGCVGHERLARAFSHASFWTYPCTKPETFCITALKAQAAGAIPIVIKGSALYETVRFGYSCTQPEDYLFLCKQALSDAENISLKSRREMGDFVLDHFTWETIAKKIQLLCESS
jgi:glycosyltransferase involved in cell wall biosynthesis